jgi:hypothetical protein
MLHSRFAGWALSAATLVVVFVVLKNLPAAENSSNSSASKPARILFVTQSFGFKHSAVTRKGGQLAPAEQAVTDWAKSSNLFTVDCTQDVLKDLTKENLQNYDIVMFYTTGTRKQWPVDDAILDYLCKDWAKQKGHAFIGVHSATDTLEDYQPYWEMIGGSFNQHPWTSKSKVAVIVDDPEHPICKPWGKEFTITDEIYQIKNWQPEKVHELMSLDIGHSVFNKDVKNKITQPYHVPIAWCKEFGDGRVFYISLGHNESVWADPRYRDCLLAAIKWARGEISGTATPNPNVTAALIEKGNSDVAAKLEEFAAQEAAVKEAADKKQNEK